MSKIAAVVLAFLCLMLFAPASRAQLLPSGNVYVGAAYGDSVDVINRYTFRGWNASFEDFPFGHHPHVGIVLDGSGFYRQGIQQYNLLIGPRLSANYGKWRPFVHIMAGAQRMTSDGLSHYPIVEDAGGGVDRKFQFLFMKHFAWRLQFDYMRTHLLSATQNDIRGSTGLVWRF
ncbi:MAG: hypothetical protein WB919_11285 [Candidatus Sulfotelmatobacter sp.]